MFNKLQAQSPLLLLFMASFVAMGPLATDMYLPAMPTMVEAFGTEISRVQLTLSAYLAGFSFFHLICGPLSDRFGRRPILFGGMLLFLCASLGCASAQSIDQLIFWRVVQGIGACSGPTLGRAMVRDLYAPREAAKALATMAAIMALAPVVAPIAGGWMVELWHWQSIFLSLAIYSAITMGLLLIKVPETLPQKQSLNIKNILSNYSSLIGNRRYMLYILAPAFLYAGTLGFLAGSSFVLIEFMHVPTHQFGYWFMFIVVGYIFGNLFTMRFAYKMDRHKLMRLGASLCSLSGLIMIGLAVMQVYHPLSIISPMILFTFALGITWPQAMAEALAPFPHMAGTASALMGLCQMAIAAGVVALVSIFVSGEPLPMAIIITGCGGASLLIFWQLSASPVASEA
ncbi:MAG: multidrug effflux MFS transporter [Pseudomonadales bacterium]